MTISEYNQLDGLSLVALMWAGKVVAAERCAVAQAQAWNPAHNAMVHPLYEAAQARAWRELP